MKLLLIIITICLLILFALKLHIWILEYRNHRIRKRNAKLCLELLKNNYELHFLIRKKYYETRFIEDPVLKNEKIDELKQMYEKCMASFTDPDILKYKQYLSEEEQKEFEKILQKPRYKLM